MKVEYKVGDILLAEVPYPKEVEIEKIAVKAKYMMIDGSWYSADEITPKIKAVLGRAVYKKGFFGVKRTVEYI